MQRIEIKLGGFGGQGIILGGLIIGKAASIYDNKHAVLTQSYGPEARGGACSADIVVSDVQIDYPYIRSPNVLVVMSQEAYKTYLPLLKNDSILIIDEDLVDLAEEEEEIADKALAVYKIPATRIAEELGRRIIANIVMLGFFTAVTDIITLDSMNRSISSSVPKGTEDLNLNAFNNGYEFEPKIKKC